MEWIFQQLYQFNSWSRWGLWYLQRHCELESFSFHTRADQRLRVMFLFNFLLRNLGDLPLGSWDLGAFPLRILRWMRATGIGKQNSWMQLFNCSSTLSEFPETFAQAESAEMVWICSDAKFGNMRSQSQGPGLGHVTKPCRHSGPLIKMTHPL